jgi:hypothetical protein
MTAALPFLIQTARYSSPDMLCALLLLTGLYVVVEYSLPWGLAITGLAIIVRPDAFIYFALLTLVMLVTR